MTLAEKARKHDERAPDAAVVRRAKTGHDYCRIIRLNTSNKARAAIITMAAFGSPQCLNGGRSGAVVGGRGPDLRARSVSTAGVRAEGF